MKILPLNWFRRALQLKGSVAIAVLPQTILSGLLGFAVFFLDWLRVPVALPALVAFVPNIVLGLLLVFRTNTAYERFWEGRKIWGGLNNDVRNLARQIWVSVLEHTDEDRAQKVITLRMLVAFAVALKQHLRHEPLQDADMDPLILPSQLAQLHQMNNPPLKIAYWIGRYLQTQYQKGCINSYQLTAMQKLLDTMVDSVGGAERILHTPIPLAYVIHLKQLLLIYCLSLPFQMVDALGWLTGPMTAVFSFTLLGIEEMAEEIEDPFGRDPNDLPLDTICVNMRRNIEDLMSSSSLEGERLEPIPAEDLTSQLG
jgi:putative membrane protein